MTLRCKPGQLAIVARNTRGADCIQARLGQPVTVGRTIVLSGFYGPAWRLVGDPEFCPECGALNLMLDADLDPIDPKPTAPPAQDQKPVERPVEA